MGEVTRPPHAIVRMKIEPFLSPHDVDIWKHHNLEGLAVNQILRSTGAFSLFIKMKPYILVQSFKICQACKVGRPHFLEFFEDKIFLHEIDIFYSLI